jgi:hypothetical protein
MKERMADRGWILLDVALCAAFVGAVTYGFMHFPVPMAMLIGACIIAGGIVYASRPGQLRT